MIPTAANSDFPIFVADQVLTSDNLNDLFGYLDEQERITRTNLLGIGIVCGLHIKTDSDGAGTFIRISKGCGITSQGYLVTVPEIKYYHYNKFDALKCRYYESFVNIATKTQIIPLWELKQLAETSDDAKNPLLNLNNPATLLNDMVVMLFVELLEANNKNCDPESCDDKGTRVAVNFRPLLVKKSDASSLLKTETGSVTSSLMNTLPDIFMQRWDLANTHPLTADDIFNGYKKVLTKNFISSVQSVLSQAWVKFRPLIADEFPGDPFTDFNLPVFFAFLYNGNINTSQTVHIQYYYDFFSDLVVAYKEFCVKANEIVSSCCPDETLFPRHLLLGEAIPAIDDVPSVNRHYFVYSPLFQRKDLLITLRSLFRRMVLMLNNFNIPPVASSGKLGYDSMIKITPSNLTANRLSCKAIPYYYVPTGNPIPLYKNWSAQQSARGRAQQILSYNSDLYNKTDDFVQSPLRYDLEPYNFFRVEGIAGKNVTGVLSTVKNLIYEQRLPVQVIALATGNPRSASGSVDECCTLSDFETQYQLLRRQLICCLKSNVTYWGSLEKKNDSKGNVYFERPSVVFPVFNKLINTPLVELNVPAAAPIGLVNETAIPPKQSVKTAVATRNLMMAKTTGFFKVPVFTETIAAKQPQSLAQQYMEFQKAGPIRMGNLPVPKTTSPELNIPYYALMIIDEMQRMADLLSAVEIEKFDSSGFASLDAKLQGAISKLTTLISDYHTTEYLVEKIRINAGQQHAADVEAIALSMLTISNSDANNIILLFLNMTTTADFIAQIKRDTGIYTEQEKTIATFFAKLNKDGMMIPIMKEPDPNYISKYGPMLDHLRNGMCTCDVDKLNYLIQRYKELKDQLTDLANFSIYARHHSGLQHKAGVTTGGTFIIVYKGTNDPRKDITANTVIGDFYIPYTSCSDCPPVMVVVNEPPPPVDQPPVAKAGQDIIIQLPVNKVSFDGSSSSDPDGTIKSYLWARKSGPNQFMITDPAAGKTDVSNLEEGVYVFTLTVTDNDGVSSSAEIKVTVLPIANKAPVANAGPNQTIQILQNGQVVIPGTVDLDGSLSSDTDGTITAFGWTKINGPAQGIISTPANVKTSVTGLLDGVYVFELTVTDNKGATGKGQVTVTVTRRINQPPVAVAGKDQTITLPVNSVTLDGTGSSDKEGAIAAFKWTKFSGPAAGTLNNASLANPTVTDMIEGVYVFELMVTDSDGLSALDKITVNVIKAVVLKSCAPLNDITSQFTKLMTPENFKSFSVGYKDLKVVQELFKDMEIQGVAAKKAEEQTGYFSTKGIDKTLPVWIDNLKVQFTEFPGMRLLALNMLNILAGLTDFVACISKTDVNKDPNPMAKALDSVIALLDFIKQIAPTFTPEQKKAAKPLVIELLNLTISERDRVAKNEEKAIKQIYLERLNKTIASLSTIGL